MPMTLIEALRNVQNHPAFEHQDIMSFAGMCSSERELLKHYWACERRIMAWEDERAGTAV